MNIFDEAEIFAKINTLIKDEAFEFTVDYKPFDDTLKPQDYAEYGYIVGQQNLLEVLIEKNVITVHDLKKLL
jgi:hypothetical protein